MATIKLLNAGKIENLGIYNIVGTVRRGFEVLGESNQGSKMHGLLLDLAADRGKAKGTKVKSMTPKGGFSAAGTWMHGEHAVMHYSTGEKHKSAKSNSVTLFFYKEESGAWVVIAAGHHVDGSQDYKIVWGERKGDYGTV